jgi:hypothetical protein
LILNAKNMETSATWRQSDNKRVYLFKFAFGIQIKTLERKAIPIVKSRKYMLARIPTDSSPCNTLILNAKVMETSATWRQSDNKRFYLLNFAFGTQIKTLERKAIPIVKSRTYMLARIPTDSSPCNTLILNAKVMETSVTWRQSDNKRFYLLNFAFGTQIKTLERKAIPIVKSRTYMLARIPTDSSPCNTLILNAKVMETSATWRQSDNKRFYLLNFAFGTQIKTLERKAIPIVKSRKYMLARIPTDSSPCNTLILNAKVMETSATWRQSDNKRFYLLNFAFGTQIKTLERKAIPIVKSRKYMLARIPTDSSPCNTLILNAKVMETSATWRQSDNKRFYLLNFAFGTQIKTLERKAIPIVKSKTYMLARIPTDSSPCNTLILNAKVMETSATWRQSDNKRFYLLNFAFGTQIKTLERKAIPIVKSRTYMLARIPTDSSPCNTLILNAKVMETSATWRQSDNKRFYLLNFAFGTQIKTLERKAIPIVKSKTYMLTRIPTDSSPCNTLILNAKVMETSATWRQSDNKRFYLFNFAFGIQIKTLERKAIPIVKSRKYMLARIPTDSSPCNTLILNAKVMETSATWRQSDNKRFYLLNFAFGTQIKTLERKAIPIVKSRKYMLARIPTDSSPCNTLILNAKVMETSVTWRQSDNKRFYLLNFAFGTQIKTLERKAIPIVKSRKYMLARIPTDSSPCNTLILNAKVMETSATWRQSDNKRFYLLNFAFGTQIKTLERKAIPIVKSRKYMLARIPTDSSPCNTLILNAKVMETSATWRQSDNKRFYLLNFAFGTQIKTLERKAIPIVKSRKYMLARIPTDSSPCNTLILNAKVMETSATWRQSDNKRFYLLNFAFGTQIKTLERKAIPIVKSRTYMLARIPTDSSPCNTLILNAKVMETSATWRQSDNKRFYLLNFAFGTQIKTLERKAIPIVKSRKYMLARIPTDSSPCNTLILNAKVMETSATWRQSDNKRFYLLNFAFGTQIKTLERKAIPIVKSRKYMLARIPTDSSPCNTLILNAKVMETSATWRQSDNKRFYLLNFAFGTQIKTLERKAIPIVKSRKYMLARIPTDSSPCNTLILNAKVMETSATWRQSDNKRFYLLNFAFGTQIKTLERKAIPIVKSRKYMLARIPTDSSPCNTLILNAKVMETSATWRQSDNKRFYLLNFAFGTQIKTLERKAIPIVKSRKYMLARIPTDSSPCNTLILNAKVMETSATWRQSDNKRFYLLNFAFGTQIKTLERKAIPIVKSRKYMLARIPTDSSPCNTLILNAKVMETSATWRQSDNKRFYLLNFAFGTQIKTLERKAIPIVKSRKYMLARIPTDSSPCNTLILNAKVMETSATWRQSDNKRFYLLNFAFGTQIKTLERKAIPIVKSRKYMLARIPTDSSPCNTLILNAKVMETSATWRQSDNKRFYLLNFAFGTQIKTLERKAIPIVKSRKYMLARIPTDSSPCNTLILNAKVMETSVTWRQSDNKRFYLLNFAFGTQIKTLERKAIPIVKSRKYMLARIPTDSSPCNTLILNAKVMETSATWRQSDNKRFYLLNFAFGTQIKTLERKAIPIVKSKTYMLARIPTDSSPCNTLILNAKVMETSATWRQSDNKRFYLLNFAFGTQIKTLELKAIPIVKSRTYMLARIPTDSSPCNTLILNAKVMETSATWRQSDNKRFYLLNFEFGTQIKTLERKAIPIVKSRKYMLARIPTDSSPCNTLILNAKVMETSATWRQSDNKRFYLLNFAFGTQIKTLERKAIPIVKSRKYMLARIPTDSSPCNTLILNAKVMETSATWRQSDNKRFYLLNFAFGTQIKTLERKAIPIVKSRKYMLARIPTDSSPCNTLILNAKVMETSATWRQSDNKRFYLLNFAFGTQIKMLERKAIPIVKSKTYMLARIPTDSSPCNTLILNSKVMETSATWRQSDDKRFYLLNFAFGTQIKTLERKAIPIVKSRTYMLARIPTDSSPCNTLILNAKVMETSATWRQSDNKRFYLFKFAFGIQIKTLERKAIPIVKSRKYMLARIPTDSSPCNTLILNAKVMETSATWRQSDNKRFYLLNFAFGTQIKTLERKAIPIVKSRKYMLARIPTDSSPCNTLI